MRSHCVDCGLPSFETDLRGTNRCLPCRKKKLGHEPRELTEDEVRERFIDHVWTMIDYWYHEERTPGTLEKMGGLAHSILVTLDGESADLPPFLVAPIPHEDNKEFSKEHIEDWYPENKAAEKVVNGDIGGSLHDTFHTRRPKGLPKEDHSEMDKPRPIHPPNLSGYLDTFTMNAMAEVFSHLQLAANDFAAIAWPSIARHLVESTSKYHSGIFGDVKVMVEASTGSALVTLWKDGKELTLGVKMNLHQHAYAVVVKGISGSANEVRAMVEAVLKNWKPDGLKRDDELGVAWKNREKAIRDLYSNK